MVAAFPAALLVSTTAHASPDATAGGRAASRAAAPDAETPSFENEAAKSADVIEGSYVVVMAADPVVAYDGGVPGLAPTAVAPNEKVDPQDPAVERYVAHIERQQDHVLAAAGVSQAAQGETYTYALNGFEARLSEAQVQKLQARPEVAKVVPNVLQHVTTDNTPKFLGLSAPGGPWAAGYTGEDVVVGMIDTGIWPEHPSFADDGSYRHLSQYDGIPCQFGNTAYNPGDTPFTCNNKLLGARNMRIAYDQAFPHELYHSARDYDGHGTHTASTAAGNRNVAATLFGIDRGPVSGIAPRARVIAYSVCGNLGCATSDLAGAIDQAVADGVDVINYSIGGGASLTSPDDMAFLFAADANVWVATSNGNDGPDPETGGGPASTPWVTAVGASTQNRTFSATARLGNGRLAIGASVTEATSGAKQLVDAADLGNALCDSTKQPIFSASVTNKIVLCLRGGNARVDKSRAVFLAGGAGMILYNPDDIMALVTDNHYVPSVHVNFTSGSAIKAYIRAAGTRATASITAGKRVSAQGSVMADFSSRGPNPVALDIIKPDVTAPGVNILAGATPTPDPNGEAPGRPGQLFQSISGTSMASPHVAGLFALLRQAHPDWTAAMAKSAVMTTARHNVVKEDTTTPADPFDMGAGHVDPSGDPSRAGSMFSPGLVYDAGYPDYLGFLCDADPSAFLDPDGTCAALASGGYPTTAPDLNVPSIGASAIFGTEVVHRTVTSVADQTRTFTADLDAPDGFDVTVSPSTLRIAPGESATFSVTFTRTDAQFDAWRFGSLTWTSGSYEVRSPLAAKAVLFAAPEAVSATGTEGSVTIPVSFGYTGAYTAAAHGPVVATPLPGTVAMDPDQTFDPNDPTGTTAIPLTIEGSAALRFALETSDLTPPNPNTDIDLYLYRGDEEVASSTNGGTDELIDVSLPADGEYTLYVHGWSVPGGSTAFSLRSWNVPLEPDTGALQIDSAPPSAVAGQSGEVVASWSGLEPGQSYLGAVSHADDQGAFATTLVAIET